MHQRTLTLLLVTALLVALIPQVALAQPGSEPPGRTPTATAAQHTPIPGTTSQPTLEFTVTPRTVRPGEQVVLAGVGCRPGERVHFQWRPYPRTASVGQLAPATARGNGSFRRVWQIPVRPGQIAVSASCGRRYSREVVLTILGPQATPTTRPDALPLTGSGNTMLPLLAGLLLALGVGALCIDRTRSTHQARQRTVRL